MVKFIEADGRLASDASLLNLNSIFRLLGILTVSGFVFSCTYDSRGAIDPIVECDSTNVTYELSIKPILIRDCIACHSGPSPDGGLDYENYGNVQSVALDGRLAGAINHLPGYVPMPPFTPKLSDCDLRKIEKWLALGALNN
jgi:hypothetical protein